MRSRILEFLQEGAGAPPKVGDKLVVHYTGCLASTGRCFDSSRARGHAFTFTVGTGRVIKGWDELMLTLRKGSRVKMLIPSDEAYGPKGSPPSVPPNADLVFDVELLEINETLVQEGIRFRREKEELQKLEEEAAAAARTSAAEKANAGRADSTQKRRRGAGGHSSDSGSSDSSSDDSDANARKEERKKARRKERKKESKSKRSKKEKKHKTKKSKKKHRKHSN